jgi:hypothetical protein
MHLPTHLFGFNFFKKYFFNELETNNYIPTHKKNSFLNKNFPTIFLKMNQTEIKRARSQLIRTMTLFVFMFQKYF